MLVKNLYISPSRLKLPFEENVTSSLTAQVAEKMLLKQDVLEPIVLGAITASSEISRTPKLNRLILQMQARAQRRPHVPTIRASKREI